jgi:hypothetical protein
MNKIFEGVDVGRKNIVFGVVLFLVLGVVVGVPLTVDLFGGSMLTESQYQTWKVLQDMRFRGLRQFLFDIVSTGRTSRRQKEIASWSFLEAGIVGLDGQSGFSCRWMAVVATSSPHRDSGSCLERSFSCMA